MLLLGTSILTLIAFQTALKMRSDESEVATQPKFELFLHLPTDIKEHLTIFLDSEIPSLLMLNHECRNELAGTFVLQKYLAKKYNLPFLENYPFHPGMLQLALPAALKGHEGFCERLNVGLKPSSFTEKLSLDLLEYCHSCKSNFAHRFSDDYINYAFRVILMLKGPSYFDRIRKLLGQTKIRPATFAKVIDKWFTDDRQAFLEVFFDPRACWKEAELLAFFSAPSTFLPTELSASRTTHFLSLLHSLMFNIDYFDPELDHQIYNKTHLYLEAHGAELMPSLLSHLEIRFNKAHKFILPDNASDVECIEYAQLLILAGKYNSLSDVFAKPVKIPIVIILLLRLALKYSKADLLKQDKDKCFA